LDGERLPVVAVERERRGGRRDHDRDGRRDDRGQRDRPSTRSAVPGVVRVGRSASSDLLGDGDSVVAEVPDEAALGRSMGLVTGNSDR
jgi:hypothetical protein